MQSFKPCTSLLLPGNRTGSFGNGFFMLQEKSLSILLKYKTTTIEILICILRLNGHARTHALLKIN